MVKRRYFDEEPFRNTQAQQRRAFCRQRNFNEASMTAKNMSFRLATEADCDAVAAIIVAMAAHYGEVGIPTEVNAAADMVRNTLSTQEGTQFLLATGIDSTPVGVACFVVIRPGRKLKGLIYLKDIFVPSACRGTGIGRQLLVELARYAQAHDIGRIDLRTDSTNLGAQRLYEGLGAVRLEKIAYTFDPAALSSR
jgi:ribosomal protein S18 acetylase RimI-like enzyme